MATAHATSVCVAAMAGANADTAVTPHMDVPAASRDPSRGWRPARPATRGMRTRPAPTEAAAAGTQKAPAVTTSEALNLAPTQTMPTRRTVPVAVRNPGRTHFGSATALLIPAPSRTAHGTPATGAPIAALMPSASANPAWDTANARPRPGSAATTSATAPSEGETFEGGAGGCDDSDEPPRLEHVFAMFHPEARPRVRASAACIHGARSAPRARELVVTPPLVAARAKSAPAARQGDIRARRL